MPTRDYAGTEHQCIVLPFQPMPGQSYDGVGLALHFLLGNVMVLHSGLKELWFGWRIKKLFKTASLFADYCRGARLKMGWKAVSQQQKVRFWVYGQYRPQAAEIAIYDSNQAEPEHSNPLPVSCSDHLLQFRRSFMDRFDLTGLGFHQSQKQAALWEERVSLKGLDAIGLALETFYRFSSFSTDSRLDPEPFENAVRQAPQAFMAHNLLGWTHYRQNDYTKAMHAFRHALTINPNGAGAMAGLIWCCIHTRNLEEALFWAERKAAACRQDEALAKEQAKKLFEKRTEGKGKEKG